MEAHHDADSGDAVTGPTSKDMTSVRVCVRVRPLSARESDANAASVCGVSGSRITLVDPVTLQMSAQHGIPVHSLPKRVFHFDDVFAPDHSQRDVYSRACGDLVSLGFAGYNVSVFAYGQTGSGKSYSMMGPHAGHIDAAAGVESEAGVIPRLTRDLFSSIEVAMASGCVCEDASVYLHPHTHSYSVSASYYEVYNDKVYDLFAGVDKKPTATPGPRRGGRLSISTHTSLSGPTHAPGLHASAGSPVPLRVREHPQTGAYVDGLTHLPVHTCEDVYSALAQGMVARTVAETAMNAVSSRSHAIFTLTFTHTHADARTAVPLQKRTARFTLVDLAGSERADAHSAAHSRTRVRELTAINGSLSALASVIKALTLGHATHIPYRNSVLTHLLRESIGGNARTSMIATVSPADLNYSETVSTLKYCESVKRIRAAPVVNDGLSRGDAYALVHELRREIAHLRAQLDLRVHSSIDTRGDDAAVVRADTVVSPRTRGEIDRLTARASPYSHVRALVDGQDVAVSTAVIEDAAPDDSGNGDVRTRVLTNEMEHRQTLIDALLHSVRDAAITPPVVEVTHSHALVAVSRSARFHGRVCVPLRPGVTILSTHALADVPTYTREGSPVHVYMLPLTHADARGVLAVLLTDDLGNVTVCDAADAGALEDGSGYAYVNGHACRVPQALVGSQLTLDRPLVHGDVLCAGGALYFNCLRVSGDAAPASAGHRPGTVHLDVADEGDLVVASAPVLLSPADALPVCTWAVAHELTHGGMVQSEGSPPAGQLQAAVPVMQPPSPRPPLVVESTLAVVPHDDAAAHADADDVAALLHDLEREAELSHTLTRVEAELQVQLQHGRAAQAAHVDAIAAREVHEHVDAAVQSSSWQEFADACIQCDLEPHAVRAHVQQLQEVHHELEMSHAHADATAQLVRALAARVTEGDASIARLQAELDSTQASLQEAEADTMRRLRKLAADAQEESRLLRISVNEMQSSHAAAAARESALVAQVAAGIAREEALQQALDAAQAREAAAMATRDNATSAAASAAAMELRDAKAAVTEQSRRAETAEASAAELRTVIERLHGEFDGIDADRRAAVAHASVLQEQLTALEMHVGQASHRTHSSHASLPASNDDANSEGSRASARTLVLFEPSQTRATLRRASLFDDAAPVISQTGAEPAHDEPSASVVVLPLTGSRRGSRVAHDNADLAEAVIDAAAVPATTPPPPPPATARVAESPLPPPPPDSPPRASRLPPPLPITPGDRMPPPPPFGSPLDARARLDDDIDDDAPPPPPTYRANQPEVEMVHVSVSHRSLTPRESARALRSSIKRLSQEHAATVASAVGTLHAHGVQVVEDEPPPPPPPVPALALEGISDTGSIASALTPPSASSTMTRAFGRVPSHMVVRVARGVVATTIPVTAPHALSSASNGSLHSNGTHSLVTAASSHDLVRAFGGRVAAMPPSPPPDLPSPVPVRPGQMKRVSTSDVLKAQVASLRAADAEFARRTAAVHAAAQALARSSRSGSGSTHRSEEAAGMNGAAAAKAGKPQ